MTRNKKKTNANGKMASGKRKAARPRERGVGEMAEYLQMLRDPCGARLVRAPYTGTGSSYLVRIVDIVQPRYAATVKGAVTADCVLEWTPWNTPAGVQLGAADYNGVVTAAVQRTANFITSQAVRGYRPIAACAKWVPTGPISVRSGVVGRAYAPSKTLFSGQQFVVLDVQAGMMAHDTNGSVAHEIKWLPSFGDERFSTTNETNIRGAGSCVFALQNIDAVGNGADVSLSGYFELTTVFEWEPETAQGITPSVAPPTRSTLQQVLSTIRDVGEFVLGHSDMLTLAYQYTTGGNLRSGPGMPRLTR